MIESDDALRVLRLFGAVEWGKFSLGHDPVDSLIRPPFILWRYEAPSPALADAWRELVEGFRGRESWVFDSSGKNWMILPKRIDDDFKRDTSKSSSEVLSNLKHSDQEFCRRSTTDAAELFARIELAAADFRAA